MQQTDELEELRVHLDRLQTLLENLVVRGLRACGPDELTQLRSFADHFDQSGAGHLTTLLADLRSDIERDEPTSARRLLETQTNVRLLQRLLTLRVVKGHYAAALELMDHSAGAPDATEDKDGDEDGDMDVAESDKE